MGTAVTVQVGAGLQHVLAPTDPLRHRRSVGDAEVVQQARHRFTSDDSLL
jgi:hypothetical protein